MKPSDASYLLPERMMEATVALQEAKIANKPDDVAKAQAELDEVKNLQAAAAASSAPQASADAVSASK